jgi:hypothetical protein
VDPEEAISPVDIETAFGSSVFPDLDLIQQQLLSILTIISLLQILPSGSAGLVLGLTHVLFYHHFVPKVTTGNLTHPILVRTALMSSASMMVMLQINLTTCRSAPTKQAYHDCWTKESENNQLILTSLTMS